MTRPIGCDCFDGCSTISIITTWPALGRQRFPVTFFRRRDQDVLADAFVLGDDEVDAMLLEHATDDLPVGTLGDLDDLAFRTSLAIQADHARDGMVAVQHLVHFLFGEEQVGAAILAHEETEAVGVPLHAALQQVGLVGNQPVVATVLQQLRIARHRPEPTTERLLLEIGDVEKMANTLEANGHPQVCERLQDVFAARQRVLIFFDFALELGIGRADFRELGCLGFVVCFV